MFFNYDKPGPGVDKNAPRKKGVFLFLELFVRNLGKLTLANMLYFAVSLPIIAVYFLFVSYFVGSVMPEMMGSISFLQISAIVTILLVIFWGTGPVSCGYTYILRNTAREEHTFLVSDFFEKIKQSFAHGMIFLIVDVVMFAIFAVSILVYLNMSKETGGIYMVPLFATILMMCVYTVMHFYLYEMETTFENSVLTLYKNSFLMAIATAPMCLLIGGIILIISFKLLGYLTPIAIIIVSFICWISFMRFIIDFYTSRVIKKNLLPKTEEDNRGTN